jgi:predicted nuclease with TOPRIM domain
MDCVMIDRLSYERLKLESEQLKLRNQELERDSDLLRNELQLMRKLNDALENIKFNLEKTLQLIREQFNLSETQFEREVIIWQEEYTNIKLMLNQLSILNNSQSSGNEVVINENQLWTNSNHNVINDNNSNNDIQTDSYLNNDQSLEQSLVRDETNVGKAVKKRNTNKRVKGMDQLLKILLIFC